LSPSLSLRRSFFSAARETGLVLLKVRADKRVRFPGRAQETL
jgi:hypothetical protein